MHLLDINILIALVDRNHSQRGKALDWFLKRPDSGWATCPLTENGVIRIIGHDSYPDGPGDTGIVREVLTALCGQAGHQFWPDEISLRDLDLAGEWPNSKILTDVYLLALAVHRQGKFVTLDREIDPSGVPGGAEALVVL